MRQLTESIALLPFPLRVAGCDLGRNVTVIRLASGKLVIHSTAPFTNENVAEIAALGDPGWLVEATNFHDTCAGAGRAAFPGIPYLAPPGFPGADDADPLVPPPPEWGEELEVVPLEGMPRIREHAFFHRPSATLILGDLFFNLRPTGWTRFFLRALSGLKSYPGMSRLFRFMIKDKDAFRSSLDRLRALPFERIVVAHGEPIENDPRAAFEAALEPHGF